MRAHAALYVLFFAVPLAGWAYSSAAGFPVVLFGVLPLPDFVAPDRALVRDPQAAAPVAGLCAGRGWSRCTWLAALKHHFVDRDGLLLRMMPARRRRAPACPTDPVAEPCPVAPCSP